MAQEVGGYVSILALFYAYTGKREVARFLKTQFMKSGLLNAPNMLKTLNSGQKGNRQKGCPDKE